MIYAPLYGAHMAMYPVYWMQGVYASAQGGGSKKEPKISACSKNQYFQQVTNEA